MIDPKEVGKRLNAHRIARGMSQQELAALMSVTHQAVSKCETGAALPDVGTLLALSRLYHTTVEEVLVGGRVYPDPAVPEMPQAEEQVPTELPALDFSEIREMAPFLKTSTVDALLDQVESLRTPEELMGLVPFLSDDRLERLHQRACAMWTPGQRKNLLPFLPEHVLEGMVWGQTTDVSQRAGETASFSSQEDDRARRALREADDAWLDEHAEEYDARELLALCRYAQEHRLDESMHLLLEHADQDALSQLLSQASTQKDWALVALIAEAMR